MPANSRRWRQRIIVLWLAGGLLGGALSAQRFGQWWWDGALGVGQRGTDNLSDGRKLSSFDQQELRASFGLNGFVLHPALGRFRLGLDLALTELEAGRSLDTERTGFEADFSFFPRGSYPFSFFYRRQLYDYARPEDDAPIDLVGAADTSEQWGGRFRIRKGPLTGTLLGLNHTSYGFLDVEAREEIQDRQFVDWSRANGRLQHHLRLAHHLRRYGRVDLEIEDLTLNLEQRGQLTQAWGWQMSGVGIQRQVGVGQDPERASEDYRLRTRLFRKVRERDQLDISGDFGSSRPEARPTIDSVGFSLFYRWRPRLGVEVAPFVRYARQAGGDLEVLSPRAGLSLSWSRNEGTVDWLVGGVVSYGNLEAREGDESREESRSGYSANASLGHGDAKRLRKEVEIEAGRNQLRLSRGTPLTDLPNLGLAGAALGDEDFYRARATLSHRWDSKWLTGWGESLHREASDDLGLGRFDSQTVTTTLQFGSRRATIQANAGRTTVNQDPGGDQEVRFTGAGVRWRPWRYLRVNGSYREDQREFVLAPDIDGDRAELGLELRIGQVQLLASLFETNERLMDGSERTNRGLRWSIRPPPRGLVADRHRDPAAGDDSVSRLVSRVAAVPLVLGLVVLGCAGNRAVERADFVSRQWPSVDPRVELEEVITNRRGQGGVWRWLTGATAPELLQRPYNVAWDGDDLIVTDPGAGRVLRVDSRGRVRATPPDLVTGPIGVAVCDEGIVVTDSIRGRVLLLSEDLRLIRRLAEGLERPTGVACQGTTVFVAETGGHRVVVLSSASPSSGESSASVGTRGAAAGEFNYPTALALDAGRLWIGDTLNFRVQQFAVESGEFLSAFGALGDAPGEMPRIKGLALDRAGQLWISDGQTDRISLYGTDGTFLMSLGATGSADGEFSFPTGIAAHPDGRVAVVDSLNRRLTVFRLVGRGAV